MTQRTSKAVLTSHITLSVGWLGAVAVFLALAITGLNSQNQQLARGCILAMKISAWFVIVPLCLTSLATGIIQAALTRWGLFRYYWIVVKLFLTLGSTLLLLLHLQPINELANAAMEPTFLNREHSSHIIDLTAKSGAAILELLSIVTISIYKPWGKIQMEEGASKSWLLVGIIGLALLVLIIVHLFRGGMYGH